ncbi:MAG: hypothetical protein M5U28_14150 [Sandaracinaceae bacterium]|nr:hypothetical protein [Sandaracinaceae bacterium]
MRCGTCQLDFVHRPGEKGEAPLAADESCARLDAHSDPEVLIGLLRTGLAALAAGEAREVAAALDAEALGRNVEALAAALGSSRANADSYLDPQRYLRDLGRQMRTTPDVSVITEDVGFDEALPLWVHLRPCVTGKLGASEPLPRQHRVASKVC